MKELERTEGHRQYNPSLVLRYLNYSQSEIKQGFKIFKGVKTKSLMIRILDNTTCLTSDVQDLTQEEMKQYIKDVILLSQIIDTYVRKITPKETTAQNIYRIINSGTIVINLYEIFGYKGYTNGEINSALHSLIERSQRLVSFYTGGSPLNPQEIPINSDIMARYKKSLKTIESKLQKNRLYKEKGRLEAIDKARIYKQAFEYAQSPIFPQSMPLKDRMIYLLTTGQIENKKFSDLEVSTIVGVSSIKVKTLISQYKEREKVFKM